MAKTVNFHQIVASLRDRRDVTGTAADLSDIAIPDEYKKAHDLLSSGKNVFLTGGAGTGKSIFIQWLDSQSDNCAIVAPTGIAASNVLGETIHSFFRIAPGLFDPEEHRSRQDGSVFQNIDYLVIDEVSMVKPNIIDMIDRTLRDKRQQDEPFGGIPTVFVGDLLQLPPVVTDEKEIAFLHEHYESHYFYAAKVFRDSETIPIALTQHHRQSGGEFLDHLNRIRVGQNCAEAVKWFNDHCLNRRGDQEEEGIRLVVRNNIADALNERRLGEVDSKLRTYEAKQSKTSPFGTRQRLPAPAKLKLKVGARVVFVKNQRGSWVNGDLGEVTALEKDSIKVRKDRDGKICKVQQASWDKVQYSVSGGKLSKKVIGSYKQYPLNLGWAITVHKSQGMTLDRMSLDLRGSFASGQAYVALSRSRTAEGISLTAPLSVHDVRVDDQVLGFISAIFDER